MNYKLFSDDKNKEEHLWKTLYKIDDRGEDEVNVVREFNILKFTQTYDFTLIKLSCI